MQVLEAEGCTEGLTELMGVPASVSVFRLTMCLGWAGSVCWESLTHLSPG